MTRFKIQMEVRPFNFNNHTAWKRVCTYVSAFDKEHALALAPSMPGYSERDQHVIALDEV